jgi:transcriptional regulator with XRE-family HTH domain
MHRAQRGCSPTRVAGTSALFGWLLKQHRLVRGFSQEALAERAGLSVRGLSDLERGVRRPQPSTIGRLAAALDLELSARTALVAAAHGPIDTTASACETVVLGEQHPLVAHLADLGSEGVVLIIFAVDLRANARAEVA